MARKVWRGRDITPPDDGVEPDLGPDERDRDLLDGSWEEGHYAGRAHTRDWRTIGIGVALLALLGMVVPLIVTVTR